jgi:dihydroneopterin aldolase
MNQIPKSKVNIHGLTTLVHLGLSEEEKANQQEVQWDVEIQFSKVVAACFDDNIDSTICYDKIVNKINAICKLQDYSLIEHLCFKVYQVIKSQTHLLVKVSVTKSPKNDNNLVYKANFTISDF